MEQTGVELAEPPQDPRERELWLQHGAGMMLCRNIRDYARGRLPEGVPIATLEVAQKAIDDALYGLMMTIDGVAAPIRNDVHRLEVHVSVRLEDVTSDATPETLDLADGDGACMGFHGWVDGEFGATPILRRPT